MTVNSHLALVFTLCLKDQCATYGDLTGQPEIPQPGQTYMLVHYFCQNCLLKFIII